MLFTVEPTQIEALSSNKLVELLRRLIYLEAKEAGIAYSNVSVPLQITVADGGEDARISWIDGPKRTNYFPYRSCFFQAKAADPGRAGWKKEAWIKKTHPKNKKPKILSNALKTALTERSAYLGFTSAALVGTQVAERIQSFREGIEEAGGDPDQLSAIGIYDANKIAAWAGLYPSVATWLHEQSSRLSLDGFTTVKRWGDSNRDFAKFPAVAEASARFRVGARSETSVGNEKNLIEEKRARERVLGQVRTSAKAVRVAGPSGIGKSRFVYELLRSSTNVGAGAQADSAIFCDYRTVSTVILPLVESAQKAGATATFVVDECPRSVAIQLSEIVSRVGSKLNLITIDTDEGPVAGSDLLIAIEPSGKGLVENIIRQRLKSPTDSEVDYISSLSGGYPRIAVLACESYADGHVLLDSIQDVVDRILRGSGIQDPEQLRSIECLSLFERLLPDHASTGQFDLVAESLGRMSGDAFYEHLIDSTRSHLVDKRGSYLVAQPRPIAVHLGRRRLERLRLSTILNFVNQAQQSTVLSLLGQIRYLSGVSSVGSLAAELLGPNGIVKSLADLDSEFGSRAVDALVHADPDAAMSLLQRILGPLDVDALEKFQAGRRYVIWALEKLVFRARTFSDAARLLLKLAAAEQESISNNATGQFKQLYQLYLSGTEVDPDSRFAIVEEALSATSDTRILGVCVEALGAALDRGNFSRSGTANEIGNNPALKDWHPKTWGEIYEFHRRALLRLTEVRKSNAELEDRCEKIISDSLRQMLDLAALLDDVEAVVSEIVDDKGIWLDGIKAVGDWLYFDSDEAPDEYVQRIRALYDALMPKSPVEAALLFTKYWSPDIRDPDARYRRDDGDRFDYSTRKATEIAALIAADDDLLDEAVRRLVPLELHNVFPFAREVAIRANDPLSVLKCAVAILDNAGPKGAQQFIRGMLNGIESGRNELLPEALEVALGSTVLGQVDVYSAVEITPAHLASVIEGLRGGTTSVSSAVMLSYGRGLDHLSVTDIEPFLSELASNHGADGVWSALEVARLYRHGGMEGSAHLAGVIKKLLVKPEILEEKSNHQRDGYLFESLYFWVVRTGNGSEEFAAEVAEQMIRSIQAKSRDAFFALDDAFRKIVAHFVKDFPSTVWSKFAGFYEVASPFERHWLDSLVGPQRHGFDGTGENGAGALFGIPSELMYAWADSDANARAPFLCTFYPIFTSGEPIEWSSEVQDLVARYGKHPAVLAAISRRIGPTAWMGSRVPHLQKYLGPLEQWFEHRISSVRDWARRMHAGLEKEIAKERMRDDEDLLD